MTYWLMRGVLALAGLMIVMLGVNVGFGGMPTLGWQLSQDFFSVTDKRVFELQDNHIRFLGGFWLGAGLVFLAGAVRPKAMKPVLVTLCGMIVVGGIARLTSDDPQLYLSADLLPSLVAEFVLFPLLALWVWRAA